MLSMDICADDTAPDSRVCASVMRSERAALDTIGRYKSVSRGETVIWAGDESTICGNLLSGVLKLVACTTQGREQIVGLLYPADFVGQPYPGRAEFTITAMTDAELCVYSRRAFERLLTDQAGMERLLLQRTLAALNVARRQMWTLARTSAAEKVAGFLIDMTSRTASSGCRATYDAPVTFDLPLSRGQIADVLGLTIQTVSRQMTHLKAAGIIRLPGGRAITITDSIGLEARAVAV